MTRLLEWLLGLSDIRLGRDAPVRLEWHTPIEPWVLVVGGLVVGAWVVSQYRRERTSGARRTGLAVMRCALIGLVVATLCQPLLVLQRNRVERSHVALLVDTSMSMAAVDHYADGALAQAMAQGASLDNADEITRTSRLELAKRLLTRDHNAALIALLKRNGVNLRTFVASVVSHGFAWERDELAPLIDAVHAAAARGVTTDLPRAIRETMERAGGRRLAAIVLVSDGRSSVATPLSEALDLAADRQIPIYPIRLGSPDLRFDVEVGPLRAQETVFANDIMAVEAQLVARGIVEPLDVAVHLVDEQTSETVATEHVQVVPGDEPIPVELRARPEREGRITYRVEVTPLEGEVSKRNNADRVLVTVRSQRVKVLYVEGYPRYEYRYLKNALVREPSIDASVLLLEADEQFVQEGTDPIRRFPETPEELNRYDVVLFGDVDPRGGWLTTAQADMLLEFVGRRGGG